MWVGHTPPERDAAGAEAWTNDPSAPLRREKAYGALYFPWVWVADLRDGAPVPRRLIPPDGHVMGVYARTDRERGVWKAPAGLQAGVKGVLSTRFSITDAVHTSLVKNGSDNANRALPGKGIVVDSSRTLSTSNLWLYVNVRLLFNFVKSSLLEGLRWVVQEPNDDTLWNKIKFNSVTPFLLGLWRRRAFGPGTPDQVFTVKIDAENNPPSNIQIGLVNIEIYFYPSRPAETIVITIGQQDGGGSANES
jgi:phage tail sheath protein FI